MARAVCEWDGGMGGWSDNMLSGNEREREPDGSYVETHTRQEDREKARESPRVELDVLRPLELFPPFPKPFQTAVSTCELASFLSLSFFSLSPPVPSLQTWQWLQKCCLRASALSSLLPLEFLTYAIRYYDEKHRKRSCCNTLA